MKYDYIIGIDPDVNKSGLAILDVNKKIVDIYTLTFPHLLDVLQRAKNCYPNLLICIEAGWLNESHWHVNNKDSKRMAAAKGNSVGRNHEVSRKISEMAQHYGMVVKEVKPLLKMWNSKDKKISHDEISFFIEPFPKTSNQEQRDAALIAWVEAGFPIKIKK